MKNDNPFVVATLTFLIFGVVILLIRLWPMVPDDWQKYVCNPADCTLQQWLSATAGWFGGLLAAAGAVVVFWQLREQKRQTAFMIGDGEPTIDVVCVAQHHRSAGFRIVNWNRRLIVVSSVTITPPMEVEGIYLRRLPGGEDLDEDDEVIRERFNFRSKVRPDGLFGTFPHLRGWEDRTQPPAADVFFLEFADDQKPEAFGLDGKQIIKVNFGFFTPSDHGDHRNLYVTGIRANLFPRTRKIFEEHIEQET